MTFLARERGLGALRPLLLERASGREQRLELLAQLDPTVPLEIRCLRCRSAQHRWASICVACGAEFSPLAGNTASTLEALGRRAEPYFDMLGALPRNDGSHAFIGRELATGLIVAVRPHAGG